jgi:type II secretory pathway component PulF
MAKYEFQAYNDSGGLISGELEADSEAAANHNLLSKGYIPSDIRKNRSYSFGLQWERLKRKFNPVKTRDLILFTKQFRTLFRAGVPMTELLKIIEKQTAHKKLKSITASLSQDIQTGAGLFSAFTKYPQAFSPLYCSVIQAGETSGSLSEVMERLIFIMEHEFRIRSEIKSALRYPVMVVLFLVVAFFVLLLFVMPKFVRIFQLRGIELPLPTKICLFMYQFMVNYWYIGILGVLGGILALIAYSNTERGRYQRDLLLLKMPFFGSLLLKSTMSRFCSIFSILQFSGVQVLESLKILSGTLDNAVISKQFIKIESEIEGGNNIANPLKAAKFFTPMVVNMVAVGEKAEKLDEMLEEVALHYDSEIEYTIKEITESVTPLLTIGLAVVVGFFALAIFLPMWDMTKIV